MADATSITQEVLKRLDTIGEKVAAGGVKFSEMAVKGVVAEGVADIATAVLIVGGIVMVRKITKAKGNYNSDWSEVDAMCMQAAGIGVCALMSLFVVGYTRAAMLAMLAPEWQAVEKLFKLLVVK